MTAGASHDPAGTAFLGRRWPLFRLALGTAVLTILTLGLYRFWMKTRLRRYYWSSIRPAGAPVEYLGTPLEKLLGFLIAVVFLAFYLGIVNLLLVFASFSLFQTDGVAYALSFLGVIPLWFYASYRARRYVLARTRWRGIRFAMAPGAWGYAWRALGHWALVIVTLGLAWPRMTFWLEKYRTDRMFYGTLPLHQGGDVATLYQGFAPLMIGVVFSGLTIAIATANENGRFLLLLLLTVPVGFYGIVQYRVHAFRVLTNGKTAGPLGLIARPRVGRVLRIWLVGGVLSLVLPLLIVATAGAGMMAWVGPENDPSEALQILLGGILPGWAIIGVGVVLYFAVFVSFAVLRHVFLTQPLWHHYAETLEVTGTAHLASVAQRPLDTFREAEGIAEALDVGAAL